MEQKILHIVCRDKFTDGYIAFMRQAFPEMNHRFLISDRDFPILTQHGKDVADCPCGKRLFLALKPWFWMMQADKIVFTGLFDIRNVAIRMPKAFWKKSYFQFWGGDFYDCRIPAVNSGEERNREKFFHGLRNAAGIINLIAADYSVMMNILKDEALLAVPHFSAPMPGDPRKAEERERLIAQLLADIPVQHSGKVRVLLGNSATEENHHVEVMEKLAHLKGEIEVVCPLSYGSPKVRDEVIQAGTAVFGADFIPVTEYMDIDSYVRLLGSCDVGVFNNDRQQAMGNIMLMSQLKKKLYLRRGTAMWDTYLHKTAVIFDVEELDGISLRQFASYSEEEKEHNADIFSNRAFYEVAKQKWFAVLGEQA